jgi:hypothetical protein
LKDDNAAAAVGLDFGFYNFGLAHRSRQLFCGRWADPLVTVTVSPDLAVSVESPLTI